MPSTEGDLVLDLSLLPAHVELNRSVAESLAIAASVVLDRLHGSRSSHAAVIQGEGLERLGELRPVTVDEAARATYGDPQEATEEGAEGVALLVAPKVFNRVVFRRLPKGTGADYLMRDPEVRDSDKYERLECSGMADTDESPSTRLRSKLAQLARHGHQFAGTAVVTHFRHQPISILFARHR